LIWVSYAVLDYWFLPRTYQTAWLIRFSAAAPFFFLLVCGVYFVRTTRTLQLVMLTPVAICGSALALITALSKADEPGHNVYSRHSASGICRPRLSQPALRLQRAN